MAVHLVVLPSEFYLRRNAILVTYGSPRLQVTMVFLPTETALRHRYLSSFLRKSILACDYTSLNLP